MTKVKITYKKNELFFKKKHLENTLINIRHSGHRNYIIETARKMKKTPTITNATSSAFTLSEAATRGIL